MHRDWDRETEGSSTVINPFPPNWQFVLKFQTRNQKHRPMPDNAYGRCKAKFCAPSVELITLSTVTKGRIWHKLFCRFSTFWKISTANLQKLWCHLPTDLEMFIAFQNTPGTLNWWRKQHPNQCIIGDAILPQTGKKLTKKCGLESGGLLWRHRTPHRKTTT